jgi:hypothetical protein
MYAVSDEVLNILNRETWCFGGTLMPPGLSFQPPFATTCRRASPVGASCFMGGECQHGAYCDSHDLTCRYQ